MNGQRKTVYYYPPVSKTNHYVDCNLRIWQKIGMNVEPVPFYFRGILKMLSFRRKEQVVLNWFEDRLNYSEQPRREFIGTVAMLLALKCNFKRIHWVRHNFVGHDSGKSLLRAALEFLLKQLSTTQITHRPIEGYSYIPHPLYNVSNDSQGERDIPFLYFGAVKKYKGLEELLSYWPKNIPLQMVGSCSDTELQNRLNDIIESRDLQVMWSQRFLPDEELNQLLSRTQRAIIPHRESAMIVSGAAYHALSCGVQLLVKQGEFAKYLQSKLGDSVETFDHQNLPQKLESLKQTDAATLKCELVVEFSDESIGKRWYEVLSSRQKKNRLIREKLNGFER